MLTASTAIATLAPVGNTMRPLGFIYAKESNMPKYDVVLKGGRVLDPANGIDAVRDIGVVNGRIEAVEPELDAAQADDILDVSGKWVMPGVIDSHVHVSMSARGGSRALGYRQMAEAGVVTAIDFAGTMPNIIEGVKHSGAGLNIGGLYVLTPGVTLPDEDPSSRLLRDTLHMALSEGSLGFKCIGGHHPMTPDATAKAIEVCNESMAYVALHCGTKATASHLEGLREVPELVGNGRLHVAHVNAYCRGMIRPSVDECMEAIELLSRMKQQLVSEVHLAVPNGTGGRCEGDDVVDMVTRNCLVMGNYPLTRTGMRQALEDGYASVIIERGGRVMLVQGGEAVDLWEASGTNIGVSFPVNLPQTGFLLTVAKDDDGDFVVDAVSTDGGYLPRNIAVPKTWAMVKMEALTPLEMAMKLSSNPARMFGLSSKGHLSQGADADITVVDPDTGNATLSLASGKVIMLNGRAVGSGGTLLVTKKGEAAAKKTRLGYQVVDFACSKLYEGWS